MLSSPSRAFSDPFDDRPPINNGPRIYCIEGDDISYEIVKRYIASMLGSGAYVKGAEKISGIDYIYYNAMFPFTASQIRDLRSYSHEFWEIYTSATMNEASTQASSSPSHATFPKERRWDDISRRVPHTIIYQTNICNCPCPVVTSRPHQSSPVQNCPPMHHESYPFFHDREAHGIYTMQMERTTSASSSGTMRSDT